MKRPSRSPGGDATAQSGGDISTRAHSAAGDSIRPGRQIATAFRARVENGADFGIGRDRQSAAACCSDTGRARAGRENICR